jgi:hypothetical protein
LDAAAAAADAVALLLLCAMPPAAPSDRIEAARREMHQRTAGGRLEDISLEELLGEGTFGKVYKGGCECCRD